MPSRKYGFPIIFMVIIFIIYAWTSRFGFSLPSLEGHMTFIRGDVWFLVCLGLISTSAAIISLFLDFKLSNSAGFIGWVLYFPVLFNILMPMFVLFFSVIGIFYTPWLILTEFDFANRLINGVIRLPDENVYVIIDGLGHIFTVSGLLIYSLSLYQLLSHTRKGQRLLTKGLYAVTRHPQYLGIFLWTLGFAMLGWRLINYLMWLTLCYSYLFLAEYEEAELERTFGQEYLNYKSKTPFLMPYIKVDIKLISRMTSERKMRLISYTLTYALSLICFYYFFDAYIVIFR